jgi:hypothetical protein
MSYTWVVKYLPEEFKDREMAELGKRGGEAKAENEGVVTESEIKEPATRRVAEEPEEPEQQSEPLGPQPEPEESPKPLLTGFEVECPECHVKLLINHVDHPNGKVTHEVEE